MVWNVGYRLRSRRKGVGARPVSTMGLSIGHVIGAHFLLSRTRELSDNLRYLRSTEHQGIRELLAQTRPTKDIPLLLYDGSLLREVNSRVKRAGLVQRMAKVAAALEPSFSNRFKLLITPHPGRGRIIPNFTTRTVPRRRPLRYQPTCPSLRPNAVVRDR